MCRRETKLGPNSTHKRRDLLVYGRYPVPTLDMAVCSYQRNKFEKQLVLSFLPNDWPKVIGFDVSNTNTNNYFNVENVGSVCTIFRVISHNVYQCHADMFL